MRYNTKHRHVYEAAGRTAAGAAVATAGSLLVTIAMSGPASAGAIVPFTLTDHVDNVTGVNTFTATGPLCASGTFVDDVTAAGFPHSDQARSGKGYVLIRSTLTCDDGSGTMNLLKHLTLYFNDSGFTDSGPVEILGGTGSYSGITGHGFTTGATDFATGIGGGNTTGAVQMP